MWLNLKVLLGSFESRCFIHFIKINYFSSIFQILENDDLSKAVCNSCINGIENIRAFFQQCFNANQELIISLRKSRPCPLDLPTHINQYVRSFNPPIGKMESSVANSLCENLRNFVRIILLHDHFEGCNEIANPKGQQFFIPRGEGWKIESRGI